MDCRRWFHPNVNGSNEAEEILRRKGIHGSFLVRHSRNTLGDFTLSVRRHDHVVHVKIQNGGDCYDLYCGETFATLAELVQYYIEQEGKLNEQNGELIELLHPLLSSDPTAERWYHGHISGKQAEMLLLEQADQNTFLVRESLSKPGNFVISVKVDADRITHIMIEHQENKYCIPGKGKYVMFDCLTELIEHYRNNVLVDSTQTALYLLKPVNASRINVEAVNERVNALAKETEHSPGKHGFWEEFEHLQQQECQHLHPRDVGKKPENLAKNRYKNILPFDRSRVVLADGDPNVKGSDYINANYINVETAEGLKVKYLATQGCLQTTTVDLWRMVWQENTRVIIMLTKCIERAKNKCIRYWPDTYEGKKMHYVYQGQMEVCLIKDDHSEDFDIREFEVELLREVEGQLTSFGKRTIYQFHFTSWPDKSVPKDPGPLLHFMELINFKLASIPNVGPSVVHCSAGIGRTGAFIVLDMIINTIKEKGLQCEIDIQKTVQQVRSERSGMVQTEQQYKFMYLVIQHYIETVQQRVAIPHNRNDPPHQDYGNLYFVPPGASHTARKQHTQEVVADIEHQDVGPTYENSKSTKSSKQK